MKSSQPSYSNGRQLKADKRRGELRKRNKSPSLVGHHQTYLYLYLYLCRLFGQKKEDSVLPQRHTGLVELGCDFLNHFYSFSLWNTRERCSLNHPVSFDFPAKKTGCLSTLTERTGLCEAWSHACDSGQQGTVTSATLSIAFISQHSWSTYLCFMHFGFVNIIIFGNLQCSFQQFFCFLLFVLKSRDDFNCYVHYLLWLRFAFFLYSSASKMILYSLLWHHINYLLSHP